MSKFFHFSLAEFGKFAYCYNNKIYLAHLPPEITFLYGRHVQHNLALLLVHDQFKQLSSRKNSVKLCLDATAPENHKHAMLHNGNLNYPKVTQNLSTKINYDLAKKVRSVYKFDEEPPIVDQKLPELFLHEFQVWASLGCKPTHCFKARSLNEVYHRTHEAWRRTAEIIPTSSIQSLRASIEKITKFMENGEKLVIKGPVILLCPTNLFNTRNEKLTNCFLFHPSSPDTEYHLATSDSEVDYAAVALEAVRILMPRFSQSGNVNWQDLKVIIHDDKVPMDRPISILKI